ncbi:MAG: response regulator [Gammaproteobacteria bacterium]|nr:response regulator [Gammaproteobacteria bacterium]
MPKNTVLIVEDDAALREMLRFMLARNGYETEQAGDAEEADRRLAMRLPDVILLDWMLPGMDGADYARKLRAHPLTADVGIIMVTAKGAEEDKIRGLDCGADDYVTKPFAAGELLARVRAALRRARPQQSGAPVTCGQLVIDPAAHTLTIGGADVSIGVKEFRLLYLLARHPDRVHRRAALLDQAWGKDRYVDERSVDVYIRRLRRALKPHGLDRLIRTVRGVGYRLAE